MKLKWRLLTLLTFLVLVLLPVGTVWASCPPTVPQLIQGSVTVGGEAADDGTSITVWTGTTQIAITTTSGGNYGVSICTDNYGGQTLVFKVDGAVGGQMVCPASPGGAIILNLVVVIVTEPDIWVSPTSRNFGNVQVGDSSSPQTFTVGNNGDADLDVGTVTIIGSNADQFEITYDDVSGETISPSGSEILQVIFSPTSSGTKTATLRIPSNDPNEDPFDVPLQGRGVTAPTPPSDICQAIEEGVEWLVDEQNPNGSWGSYYTVATTAFALLKLETHATDPECGYGLPSPLDSRYPYRQAVEDGLDYIMDHSHDVPIGSQTHGDPDANGDGWGIKFYSPSAGTGHETYETAVVLMALGATREFGMYGDVAQGTVDWLAWAQIDCGNGRGGWYYTGYNNACGSGDQSPSGWATLGLEYAEGMGCEIPDFVRDELALWVDYIQCDSGCDDGGAGYTSPCYWVNVLKTGSLLQQMEFLGYSVNTPAAQDAIDYIVRHWDDPSVPPGETYCGAEGCAYQGWRSDPTTPGSPAHYQAAYCVMKGLESYGIDEIDSIDWFADIAEVLLEQQNADGSWPGNCCWGYSDGAVLCTTWALLTLQKAVAKAPAPSIYCEFKATPTRGMVPLVVLFTNLSTGPFDSVLWDFGDGMTSTQQTPRHIYTQPGRYFATLTLNGQSTKCVETIDALPDMADSKEGPNLATAYLLISPEQGRAGQVFEISINVGNDGGATGTRSIALFINGELEQSQTVSVTPGSSKLLVFQVTKYEPGTYQVWLEGNEGQFTVIAPQKARYLPGPLGTPGIIVIVVVAVVLIGAIVFVFLRRE